jgi:diguanylate cyclase (GGDEF)-like protein
VRDTGSRWLAAWSVDLAILACVNAMLAVAHPSALADMLLFACAQALAGAVLMAVPALQALTNGPRARLAIVTAAGLFALRAALWLGTDLVVTHRYSITGAPLHGPLYGATFLAPLAIVAAYAVMALARTPGSQLRALLTVSATSSAVLIVLLQIAPLDSGGTSAPIIWTLPLVVLLVALAFRKTRIRLDGERHQAAMRADQVALSNAVWFQREPEAMLALAVAMARETLDDPGLTGSVRRLARGSHVVGLYPDPATPRDDLDAGYLDMLTRIVTTAADQHALAADMREAALTDRLTKLPNRPALEAHLHEALARADELRSPLAVIFCDIDDFKKVNDEHGHPRGDAILVEVAGRFAEIVGETAYVARFGGDEFVVVLPDAGTDAEILDVARRLRTSLAPGRAGAAGAPSLSAGVALWTPGEDRDPVRLLRDADTAMYGAKAGRDGVLMFDQSLRERLLTEIEARSALSRGVDADEIEAHFQPVVDGTTRRVRSYEALARWRHGDTVRLPGDWLPVAEQSGLIVLIGLEMIRQARTHSDETGLPVAVNVSPRQLMERSFVADVMLAWGCDRWDCLILEITESALVEDLRRAEDALAQLRALGVRVALDDFGTGYSSIARLGGLPIDVLKIDRAFVVEVLTPRGQAVIRAILALADAYDLDVIAEGVECEEELAALATLGSMEIQGYLTGRPAPSVAACEESA